VATLTIESDTVQIGHEFTVEWRSPASDPARILWVGASKFKIGRQGKKTFDVPPPAGTLEVRLMATATRVLARMNIDVVEQVTPPTPDPDPEPEPPPGGEVLDFFLINATSDLRQGGKITASNIAIDNNVLPQWSIEAAANADTPGPIGSIRFTLNGTLLGVRTGSPYGAWGDLAGDFTPSDLGVGTYVLLAEAFSGTGATGTNYGSVTRTLNVSDTAPPPPDPDPDPDPPPPDSGGLPTRVTSVLTPAALAFVTKAPGTNWKLTGRMTFNTNVAQGDMFKPGSPMEYPPFDFTDSGKYGAGKWRFRQTDPSFNDSSGRGNYKGQWTCYVENNELIEYIRNGPESAPFVHQASPLNRLVSRPLLVEPGVSGALNNTTRRFAWRIDLLKKFPGINDNAIGSGAQGYKCAHLLWGQSTINTVGYAEYDMPEHRFGDGLRCNCFLHNPDNQGGQTGGPLELITTNFHLYTLEYWADGYKGRAVGYCKAYVDGIERYSTTNVNALALYYAMQTETFLDADPIPTPTSTGPQGKSTTRLFQIWEPI
jgi:hypothetical protein